MLEEPFIRLVSVAGEAYLLSPVRFRLALVTFESFGIGIKVLLSDPAPENEILISSCEALNAVIFAGLTLILKVVEVFTLLDVSFA